MTRTRKYEITKREAIDRWARYHPKVMTWLAKLQRKKESAWHLWLYCKKMGKTPNELLAMKDDPRNRAAEYLLDQFVADETLGLAHSVKVNVVIAVKSFYKHNYRDLAKASGSITLIKKFPYRKHTKEELLKIIRSAQNPRDRALITFTWSTAIARESLILIKWKHLEPGWEKQDIPHVSLPDTMIKGKGRGKYKGVRQETFLTPEAKQDLVDYKDWLQRVRGITLTPESHIFVELHPPYESMSYSTLTKVSRELSKRSGIEFSWHDARRYVETALEEIKIHPNWARKIRGRKVRGEEAPYSRPAIEQLRKAYREAVPLLQFTQPTKPAEADMEKIAKKQVLLGILKTLNITEKEAAAMFHGRWPARSIDEEIEFYEEIIQTKRKEKENNDCPNSVNCGERFEQIHEGELLEYLRDGWQIVQKLSNGEVIVKR